MCVNHGPQNLKYGLDYTYLKVTDSVDELTLFVFDLK